MKRYKYLVLAVLLTLVGRTYADNLTVAEVELKAGESKEIAINLVNPTNKYTAFQFDLVLPDGVTIEKKNNGKPKASLNVDRIDDHTLTATDMGSNTYRFLAYSMSNAEFYGTSGALVKVTLKAEEGLGSGGKTATIKNQVFTMVSGDQSKWDDVSFTISIAAAVVPEITADNKTREYGEENPAFTYTTSAPLNGEPELTTRATKTSPIGEYDIIVGRGTIIGDYTATNGKLTITKAPLKISGGTYTMKQGDALPTFTASYSGFKNGETQDVLTKKPTLTTTATSSSAPGTYDVIVSGAEAQNYEITYEKGTLTISEADPVTVTAKSYTRAYGDANPTFEYEVSGATLVGVPEITCEATATSPVGTYPIVVKKGSVTNYNVTYVAGTLTITKAPLTIKAGTYTKKQGEKNPEFTLTYEGFKNNETKAVLTKQPTVSCNATESSAPGEYPVIVSGAEAQNYAITYVNGTLIVESNSQVIDNVTYEVTENGVVVSDGSGSSGDVVIPTSVEVNGQNYPVTAVGENAFKGNTALTSVSIPDGVVKIGAGAFEGCSNLMTIVIGADVANIGDKAFANIGTSTNAPRRTKGEELLVKCYPLNVPTTASNAFEGSPISSGTLLVEDNSATAYKAATPWRQFGTIMGFNEAAGIKAVWGNEDGNAQIFSLDGKPLNELQKSVNIVRMGNGKVRKVVVK